MNIAVIGSGISGLTAAYHLSKDHQVTVFEARNRLGGHTHTVDVPLPDGKTAAVDTGFIVYNEKTYPLFTELLATLQVATQPSDMSFSVKCERTGLEYNGHTLNTLFAQRRNLVKPGFWLMIRDILRFNDHAKMLAVDPDLDQTQTLGDYLDREGYGSAFVEQYILPMGAAIWSSGRDGMLAFPLAFFLRFFHNHGMLNINDRPQWRVLQGGSRSYLAPLTAPFADSIRLNSPVTAIRRLPHEVLIEVDHGEVARFNAVVIAAHSDQALRLLEDPSPEEQRVLGAVPYSSNHTVLHWDDRVLPRAKRAWAAWNYHRLREDRETVSLTYNMNILQSLDLPRTYCVTLNYPGSIDRNKIVRELTYQHPIFTVAGERAKTDHGLISGHRNTYYCGAYWFNGFHEDGVRSGLRVVSQIKQDAATREVVAI
ncbi:NAD(P)/FAD-dependent oxidoreductase [Acanthopleuribacter pedis]|uniref:FAD-dependent oxidoreductase n=1 Tax=Acanthopleuribacter pedis TaxID=442870 RepID=A0A8J7U450_9BACT|nr:FAD-dependent oxidoreductase [Acanthopleuribacter pedis]MBO1321123.1 FAD-dependent oxidoreductase [Acanthopleuribacter pedis]